MNEIYEFILDFVSHWHGISHNVSVEKDKVTVTTFPDEDKPTMNDVRFLVWEGGTHTYAKIGKLDIVDENGNQKWDTRQEAEAAARWYIEKYW